MEGRFINEAELIESDLQESVGIGIILQVFGESMDRAHPIRLSAKRELFDG
jgi:hypothetical protein